MVFRTCLSAVLCAALAGAVISAQSEPGPVLVGVVRDSTGAVMVSAEVLVTSTRGDRHTTVTDGSGRFAVHGLARGRYVLTASAAGFADATQSITVGAQPTVAVDLVLHLVVVEHVEVSTEASLSGSTGLTATTLSGAALEALPDDPGSLLRRIRELAGATDDVGQVIVTVDGFEQSLWLPPKQAIQAIRISSNWFAAEFAEPGRARVDIITKPGSSKLRGEVRANFNDEALNSRNALAPRDQSGHMREATGYVSGPLIPGRLSVVAYRGYWSEQQNHVINATVLGPDLRSAPLVDTVATPSRVDNLWVGTTYQVAPLHTLAVSFSGTTERAENLGLESGLDLTERAYRRTASDRALRATLTSVPSPRALNELRVQINPQQSTFQADSSATAVIVLDAFSSGGNQEALFSASRQLDIHVIDSVTFFVPRHTVKAGFDVRSARRRYSDAANTGGAFMFGSDFERDASGTSLDGRGGERMVISPLENYRRTLLGLPGYGPSQFWTTTGQAEVAFRESVVGVFAQDDWIMAPRLTLSYGVRSDWQTAASQPGVALRAGLAIALDDKRKNVIRAGTGTFYQRLEPEVTLDPMRFDGVRQQRLFVERPAFFPVAAANLSETAAPSSTVYVRDAVLQAPQLLISAASYERELTAGSVATFRYSYQHGTDLLRTRAIGAPTAGGSRMLQYESTGRLKRQELASGWRWNGGERGSVFANYHYIHGRSDTDGRGTIPADGTRLDWEMGPTAADRAHAATVGAHFRLPADLFVSPYVTAASGRVFNVTTGFDSNGDGVFADRPGIATAGTPGAIQTPYGFFIADRAADAPMAERNIGRDPAMLRMDLRVARAFRFAGGASFTMAANVENVFNRANFEAVNGIITSPTFGLPKRAGAPRRVNFAAGVSF